MAQKKRPGQRWFMLALDYLWQEHKTPQNNSYVVKEGRVLAWSLQVVKAAQFKMLFVVKVGTIEHHTWATLTGWELASVQALRDHVDVILENFAMLSAHMFMHQFSKLFDPSTPKGHVLSQT